MSYQRKNSRASDTTGALGDDLGRNKKGGNNGSLEPFMLKDIGQLVQWIDILIRKFTGEFGPIIDELKNGAKYDDPEEPEVPAATANKIRMETWKTLVQLRNQELKSRKDNRQKFIGVVFEYLPPNVVDRVMQRNATIKMDGGLYLLKKAIIQAFSLKNIQSMERQSDIVTAKIYAFKTRGKVFDKEAITAKLKDFTNSVLGLNDSYGLPVIPWNRQLHILFECLAGDLQQLHVKYLNQENEIELRRPPPGQDVLTAGQIARIEDDRSWYPRSITDFEDMVLRYELPKSTYATQRETSLLNVRKDSKDRKNHEKSYKRLCFLCNSPDHSAAQCTLKDDFETFRNKQKRGADSAVPDGSPKSPTKDTKRVRFDKKK